MFPQNTNNNYRQGVSGVILAICGGVLYSTFLYVAFRSISAEDSLAALGEVSVYIGLGAIVLAVFYKIAKVKYWWALALLSIIGFYNLFMSGLPEIWTYAILIMLSGLNYWVLASQRSKR